MLRIVNYELLANTSQSTSSATCSFFNITEKDDHQVYSDQALEGFSIALPDAFVVEGASYHLIARWFFLIALQREVFNLNFRQVSLGVWSEMGFLVRGQW